MSRNVSVFCMLLLCACLPVPPAADLPPPTPDTCGIAPRASFVGQPVSALVTAGLAGSARIIRPGDAVTEDYSEARLNVDLDTTDTITRFWCG